MNSRGTYASRINNESCFARAGCILNWKRITALPRRCEVSVPSAGDRLFAFCLRCRPRTDRGVRQGHRRNRRRGVRRAHRIAFQRAGAGGRNRRLQRSRRQFHSAKRPRRASTICAWNAKASTSSPATHSSLDESRQPVHHHARTTSRSIPNKSRSRIRPPGIDPQQPADKRTLTNTEIQAVPYSAPQDYRNALQLMNGVYPDNSGQFHFNGAAVNQTNYTLDGFNISNPVTGQLDTRINIDTMQTIELMSGRFTADSGRGSGGVLELTTKIGDDHWRFVGTNFIPSIATEWRLSRRQIHAAARSLRADQEEARLDQQRLRRVL